MPLAVITDVYATGPTAANLVVRGSGGETHEIERGGLRDYGELRAAIARLRSGEDPRTVTGSYADTERGGGARRCASR